MLGKDVLTEHDEIDVVGEIQSTDRYARWDPEARRIIEKFPRRPFPAFPFKPIIPGLMVDMPLFFGNMQAAHAAQLLRGDMWCSIPGDERVKSMAAQSIALHVELRTHIEAWKRFKQSGEVFMLVATMGAGKTTAGAAVYDHYRWDPEVQFLAFVNQSELHRYDVEQRGYVGTASGYEFPASVFDNTEGALEQVDKAIKTGKKPVVFVGEALFVFMREDGQIDEAKLGQFIDGLIERKAFIILDVLNTFATSFKSPVAKAIISILAERGLDVHSAYMFSMSSYTQTMASLVVPHKRNQETGMIKLYDPTKPIIGVIPTGNTSKLSLEDPFALLPATAAEWQMMAKGALPSMDALHIINDLGKLGCVSLPLFNATQPEFHGALTHYLGLPGSSEEVEYTLIAHTARVAENKLFPEF
jgi:hypothetical protein